MGTIAETIFVLTVRQLASLRRGAVLILLAAIPIGIAVLIESIGDQDDDEVALILVQTIIAKTVVPLITLIVAAPVFADEIEDRTLTNLMLSPISRWQIALPKMAAAVAVAAVPLVIGSFIAIVISLDSDAYTAAIVAAFGVLIATLTYVTLFTFVGTITSRAVIFGLVFVFGFETLLSNVIPGLKYLSISGMSLAVMDKLHTNLVSVNNIETIPPLTYSIIATVAVIIVCTLATVWRLKRMDVH